MKTAKEQRRQFCSGLVTFCSHLCHIISISRSYHAPNLLRPKHSSDSMCPPPFPKEIVPRLQADKQNKMPLRDFPLNLRPSWQPDKFLPSRGMEGGLETELSTMGILETPSKGKRKPKEETNLNVYY